MAFSRTTTRAIGTSATALNTAVPAATSWTIYGLSLCNKTAGAISVSMYLFDGTNSTYILYNFNIPAGETLFPFGAVGKCSLITGDQLFVVSSVAASVDVVMPYLVGT